MQKTTRLITVETIGDTGFEQVVRLAFNKAQSGNKMKLHLEFRGASVDTSSFPWGPTCYEFLLTEHTEET